MCVQQPQVVILCLRDTGPHKWKCRHNCKPFITIVTTIIIIHVNNLTDPQNKLSKIYDLQGLGQWYFCVRNKTLAVYFHNQFPFLRIVTVGFLLFAKAKFKIGK